MGNPPGAALVAEAADADPVTRLVLGWLAGKQSANTRNAYAQDIGITPRQRAGRAPSWLAWCQEQGVHPVTGVTGLHVALYARRLEAAGLSPASAARKLAAISGWYAWLVWRGHITASPAGDLPRPKCSHDSPATPGLTREHALALVRAADAAPGPQRARTAALVAVLLFTGARVCEVIAADVEDLGTDQGRRVLWVTRQDGRRQSLALCRAPTLRIDAYLAGRPDVTSIRDQAAHPGARPRRVLFATATGRRLFAADVWRTIRRLARQADLPGDLADHLGPDALRHTFATLYLEAGGSLRDLQAVMGHADPRTTRRYDRARHVPSPSPGRVVAEYLAAQPRATWHVENGGLNGAAGRKTRPTAVGARQVRSGR
jgi:integrase/recombinase XerD